MENAIFMYDDGYILLEDLQSQFSSGLIPSDDNVQVFRRGSRFGDSMPVADVIEKFCGPTESPATSTSKPSQNAVKPQPSPFLSNSLLTPSRSFKKVHTDSNEPSTSTAPGARKPKSKMNSMILLKLMNQKKLKGYPLFDLSRQESDGEAITGQNVIDELVKLEASLKEIPNQSTKTEYFQAVEKIHGKVTCLSCNFIKKCTEDAFIHLFSDQHKKKLSGSKISKNSFQFWIDHIEECKKLDEEKPVTRSIRVPEPEPEEERKREKKVFTEYENPRWRTNRYLFPGRVMPRKPRQPLHFSSYWPTIDVPTEKYYLNEDGEGFSPVRFPLFYSNVDDEPLELKDSHMEVLAELFSKLKPSYLHIMDSWLGRFMYGKVHPNYCETCNCFITKSYWKITKHVLSKKHLMSLESASLDDYNFWLYGMRASVPKGRINYTITLNYISPEKLDAFNRPENVVRIQLLDVPRSQYGHISKRQYIRRHEAIRFRLSTAKLNRKKKFREVKYFCYHCPGKPKLSTMWEVIEHVFNDEHCVNISYLAYPNDFVYYENLIDEYTLPTSKQKWTISKNMEKLIYER